MKYVFWLLLAALGIWAWQNPEKVRDAGDNAAKWIGEKSRMIADKWDPKAPEAPVVEAPLPELPEGVYVLRQDVIVATGKGTVKWAAGTSIRKLGEGAGKILVSDGVNQTTVDLSLLTRDQAERRAFYKKLEALNAGQAMSAARTLEAELIELDAKIVKMVQEKRSIAAARAINGGLQPFGTTEEFLDLSIKRAEDRKNEIYKILGRTPTPSRSLSVK
ncbi:hypothetical protein [Roseimicrobium gellanilyticum]|nr:hypothetical protein [Roseimicrobium gellanilyticum]